MLKLKAFAIFAFLYLIGQPTFAMDRDHFNELKDNVDLVEKGVKKQIQLESPDTTRVLVVGLTGVGKTTLVHSMAQRDLNVKRETAKFTLDVPEGTNHLPGLRIGHTLASETSLPGTWYDSQNKLCYWDCPGFMDNRGPSQEIINAFAIDQIFKAKEPGLPTRFKTLMVLQFSEFEDHRGTGIIERMVNRLMVLFPEKEQLMQSLCLVVTKRREEEEFSSESKLQGLIESITDEEKKKEHSDNGEGVAYKKEDLTVVRELLSNVLNRKRVFTFPSANCEGTYSLFSDRPRLLAALKENPVENPNHTIPINLGDGLIAHFLNRLTFTNGNVAKLLDDFNKLLQNRYKRYEPNSLQDINVEKEKKGDILQGEIDNLAAEIRDLQGWQSFVGVLTNDVPQMDTIGRLVSGCKEHLKADVLAQDDFREFFEQANSVGNFVSFIRRLDLYKISEFDLKGPMRHYLQAIQLDIGQILLNKTSFKTQKERIAVLNKDVADGKTKQEAAEMTISVLKKDAEDATKKLEQMQKDLSRAKEDAVKAAQEAVNKQKEENDKQIAELKKQLETANSLKIKEPFSAKDMAELMQMMNRGGCSPCGGGGMSPMPYDMPGGSPFSGGGSSPFGGGAGRSMSSPSRSMSAPRGNANMVRVSGYTKANGTVVQGYYRSFPGTGGRRK